MLKIRAVWGVTMALLLGVATAAAAQTEPYPLPGEIARSQTCEVTADGVPIPVMDTAVNLTRTWTSRPMTTTAPVAWLTLDGTAKVSVRYAGQSIRSATVRPLALGIASEISGDTVCFTLTKPAALTVEINGAQEGALHLFADAPQTEVPAGEGVIAYGAGVHDAGTVTLTDGQTVYLAPGAVVRGQFVADGAKDITLCGRGIIDGSTFDRWDQTTVPVDFRNCQQVSVSGVTILDPAAWTLNLYRCEDVPWKT